MASINYLNMTDKADIGFSVVNKFESIRTRGIKEGTFVYVVSNNSLCLVGNNNNVVTYYAVDGTPTSDLTNNIQDVVAWNSEKNTAEWITAHYNYFQFVRTEQAKCDGYPVFINRKLTTAEYTDIKKYFVKKEDGWHTSDNIGSGYTRINVDILPSDSKKYFSDVYFIRVPLMPTDITEVDKDTTIFLLDKEGVDPDDNKQLEYDLYFLYNGEWEIINSGNGSNSSSMPNISVGYNEFVSMMNNEELQAGRNYIMNYTPIKTTSDSSITQYHNYDIIITATSKSTYDKKVRVSTSDPNWDNYNLNVSSDDLKYVEAYWQHTSYSPNYAMDSQGTGCVYMTQYNGNVFLCMDVVGTTQYCTINDMTNSRMSDSYGCYCGGNNVSVTNIKRPLGKSVVRTNQSDSTYNGVDDKYYTVKYDDVFETHVDIMEY